MVAELVEEEPLQLPRGLVGGAAATEGRVDRQTSEPGDAAADVRALVPHRAGALAVDLHDHAAERLRLVLGALDLGRERLTVRVTARSEERVDLLVGQELDEEVEVVAGGPADRDRHGLGVTGSVSGARRGSRSAPEPTATPPRISASPAIAAAVIGSSSSSAPYTSAIGGMR